MKKAEIRKLMEEQRKKNSFVELLKTSNHYFNGFEKRLSKIEDPRHSSYIDYPIEEIIYPVILKNMFNLNSMREIETTLIPETAVDNLRKILKTEDAIRRIDRGFSPSYVTINDCFEEMDETEIEGLRVWMVNNLIRRRSFENARFLNKHWLIIVDATQIYSSNKKHCDKCLTKTHTNKETGETSTTYHHNVLEAKLVIGENLVISIATEFIENDSTDAEAQKKMGKEKLKQDCELKAFKRMAEKLKKSFKRLPICIMGDSLYASETLFKICEANKWEYLIRFKDGSIPSVAEEFHRLKDIEKKNYTTDCKWVNEISYKNRTVNVMEFMLDKEDKKTLFQWISSITITKSKAEIFAETGRKRWKIENEGFNIQKNHRYEIKHMNSLNYNAMKIHYLLTQVADIILQLYEKGDKLIKALKMTIKKISSELVLSFARQLTIEDISYTQKRICLSIP